MRLRARDWRRHRRRLATLCRIGFEGRYDYGAIGCVTNLAARLSDAAVASQVLLSQAPTHPLILDDLLRLGLASVGRGNAHDDASDGFEEQRQLLLGAGA